MGEILEGIQAIYDFFTIEIYIFLGEMFSHLATWIVIWWFKAKVSMLAFLWGVAQGMLEQLNLSAFLQQHWGNLDNDLLGFVSRYKLPEAINIILNANVTAWLWRMVK